MRTGFTFIHGSDELYGSDRVLLAVASLLERRRGPVQVILPNAIAEGPLTQQLRTLGVSVERRRVPVFRSSELGPFGFVRLIFDSLMFIPVAISIRHTTVIVHTSATLLTAVILRASRCPRIVFYLHEYWERRQSFILGVLANFAHSTIAVSVAAQSRLPHTARCRSTVIYNGFQVRDWRAPTPPCQALRVLFVGRLTERKGIFALLDVWPADDLLRLTIVGGEVPGVEQRIRLKIDGRENIKYIGEVTDVEPYYRDCHVVVIPSLRPEGLGLVAVEALAHGRPVIATQVPGLTEVVDASTGWLLDPEDSRAWCETLKHVTPHEAMARSHACRNRFERHFDMTSFEARILAFF